MFIWIFRDNEYSSVFQNVSLIYILPNVVQPYFNCLFQVTNSPTSNFQTLKFRTLYFRKSNFSSNILHFILFKDAIFKNSIFVNLLFENSMSNSSMFENPVERNIMDKVRRYGDTRKFIVTDTYKENRWPCMICNK